MAEFLRIYKNKTHMLLVVIILLVNGIFCFLQCNDTQEITKTGEELTAYLESYPEYVENTLENAKGLQVLSLFSKNNSFVFENIQKTVKDFEKMQKVRPVYGENRGIVALWGFELSDFLLVGYGIFLILMFTAEQKKGLCLLTFATINGRSKLCFWRLVILFLGLMGMSVLLYGSDLLVVCSQYPGVNFSRPIQSIPEFMKCTFLLSIGQYYVFWVGIKFLAACGICAFLYAIWGFIRNGFSMLLFLLVIVGEYFLNRFIGAASLWNPLKYLNLYALLRGQDCFRTYYNLNLWEKPVGIFTGQFTCVLGFLLGMFLLGLIGHSSKPLSGSSLWSRLWDSMVRFVQKHKPIYPAFLWEGRKIMVTQGGILIVGILFYLAFSATFQTDYLDFRNRLQSEYYEEYEGPITQEKLQAIRALEAKYTKRQGACQRNIERIRAQIEELASNGMEIPSQVGASLSENEVAFRKYSIYLDGLRPVLQNAESAKEYMDEHNVVISLMEPHAYNMLLRDDVRTYHRNRLYGLICMILVFSGVMTYEKTSHMETILHTMPRGGKRLLLQKIGWIVFLSVALVLPLHLVQFIRIGQIIPYKNMQGLVQSLEILRSFPFEISIRTYLFLLYAYRCMIAIGAGLLVLLVGKKCRSRIGCLAVCFVCFLIPVFLLQSFS